MAVGKAEVVGVDVEVGREVAGEVYIVGVVGEVYIVGVVGVEEADALEALEVDFLGDGG